MAASNAAVSQGKAPTSPAYNSLIRRSLFHLFRPHASLTEELNQRRSYMLAGMLFLTLVFSNLGLVVSFLDYGPKVLYDVDTWLIVLGVLIVGLAFLMNRSGKVDSAAKIFIVATALVFGAVPFIPGAMPYLVYFSVVPILLTAIFFTVRSTIQVTAVIGVVATGLSLSRPDELGFFPLYFMLIVGSVIYLFINHLQFQEAQRRATLEQANQLLRASEESLERRVQERTRDLELAANVSLQIATQLDQVLLLANVVEETAKAFDLYHVSIFLYDEREGVLRLTQGVGTLGQQMVAMGKQFHLSDRGLVPGAAQTQQPTLSNNVVEDPLHFANALLPDTRSELAIPMTYLGRLIGVLDLQSERINRFRDEDIRIMRTLADQIAVAARNAFLFEETRAAKEAAEKADRVKSAFLASMSHELRTPLNAIINFAKFLKKGLPGPINEEQAELVGSIASSGQHLLTLINDVLDMSKIEAGSLRLYVESGINLRSVIQSAFQFVNPLLADKAVELRQEIPEGLPLMTGDRKRLLQIFLNILSNACKFTEEGFVLVRVTAEGDRLLASVQDTGSGIAPEDSEHVFTAFKQTESGLRQGGGGTGLGMPICQKLVEAHNGRIWFESEVGRGTTFYVELPTAGLEPERSGQNA